MMSLIKSMEHKIDRLEKKIEKEKEKMNDFQLKYNHNNISKIEFQSMKKRIEEMIKVMNLRMRILKGEIIKKKRIKNL